MDKGVIPIIYEEGIYLIDSKTRSLQNESSIMIEGNASARIMCLFLEKNSKIPGKDQKTMVSNLLKAINISTNDYCWTVDSRILNMKELLKEVVFVFQHESGTQFQEAELHKWFEFEGKQFFKTYALSELEKDNDKKRELWNSVKNFRME